MSQPPTVSIGVPVYNGDNFLEQALDSLIHQTYDNIEIIISDNASTDGTEAICRKFADADPRIQYHRYDVNKGAAWNFNNTFYLAKGKYFKWAAHDDLHSPTFIARCVEIMEQDSSIILAFTRSSFIDSEGKTLKEVGFPIDFYMATRRERFRFFANGGHIVHEIFGVIRADILGNTRLIDGYLGSDLVLLAKLSLSGPFYQVDEVLFQHREHEKRSMLNPQGAKNKTEWYDASKKGKHVFPFWRRAGENARNVLIHQPMPITEKVSSLFDLLRVANWNRKDHLEEIVLNLKLALRRD